MRLIDADEIRIKPEYMHDICGVAMIRVEDIARILNDMLTIQPEQVRTQMSSAEGKWIDKSGGIEDAWNYCSICGEQAIDLYDFCPNCGADMRGEMR